MGLLAASMPHVSATVSANAKAELRQKPEPVSLQNRETGRGVGPPGMAPQGLVLAPQVLVLAPQMASSSVGAC